MGWNSVSVKQNSGIFKDIRMKAISILCIPIILKMQIKKMLPEQQNMVLKFNVLFSRALSVQRSSILKKRRNRIETA